MQKRFRPPLIEDLPFLPWLALSFSLSAVLAIVSYQRPSSEIHLEDLNASVVLVAFDVSEVPTPRRPTAFELPDGHLAAGPTTSQVTVEQLSFEGTGDWSLGSYVLDQKVAELGSCYEAAAKADGLDTLVVDLGRSVEVRAGRVSSAECLRGQFAAWPWPGDLEGRLTLTLRSRSVVL
ncbi:MAG TPA: hypothetical protein QGF58_28170 [Myxococcota bacterium]|nr:hypothetical protein [Myxococcota bacterium]